jgi:hypothetical protein
MEKLAVNLESEAEFKIYRGPCSESDLRMAARCVRAWVKMDQELEDSHDVMLRVVYEQGYPKWMWWSRENRLISIGRDAFEAVEWLEP